MKNLFKIFLLLFLFITITSGNSRKGKFLMDERYVCTVKKSCKQCLKLPHCSWCPTENKCFSKDLITVKEFCSNDTIDLFDYGLSFEENAACSCSKEDIEQHCYPPGVTTGPECSGRGKCVCGQCVCDPLPDPEEPSKMVMGEYCEFDNFSCEGPRCNEGPYSMTNHTNLDEDEHIPAV